MFCNSIKRYILEYHYEELEEIINDNFEQTHYSLTINFINLISKELDAGTKILRNPRHYLPLCDASIVSAQKSLTSKKHKVKNRVHLRIIGIPIKEHLGGIGELVSIVGIVVRMSQPTGIKLSKHYKCRKCQHTNIVNMKWERNSYPVLKECKACESSNIEFVPCLEPENYSDQQEIKVQDKCQTDSNSSSVTGWQVVLLDDLVDQCKPGDQVEISGFFVRRWLPAEVGQISESKTFMFANSVSVQCNYPQLTSSAKEMKEGFTNYWITHKDNPLVGRDLILEAICPKLYGMYFLKLALAVVLAGGVMKTNSSGINVRGDLHMLLVGDPGTGKSQILQTATNLVVPSIRTTGIGSTSAGLTAAAVKDSDGWHLEAGALVLADGGICCVDEFATMSAHDRACVHEAMEQQTISIAKAGLVSTLNSRCSVIAAINPEGGHFKEEEEEEEEEYKTRLGNPLLSRFDLIFLLKDNHNLSWDKVCTAHLLKAQSVSFEDANKRSSNENSDQAKSQLWKEDNIREYLAHIHSLKPEMTVEADNVLQQVFVHHRFDSRSRNERRTVRQLESLVRLAEGHARLMYRSEVLVMDAVIAAQLMGSSSGLGKEIGSSFPSDPMASYYEEGMELLNNIGLSELQSFL